MRILISTNIHIPLHQAVSGMELSSLTFLEGLSEISDDLKLQVTVMAHSDSKLPPNINHWKLTPKPLNQRYEKYGEHINKWHNFAIEVAFQKAFLTQKKFDLMHDQSSAFSPSLQAMRTKTPFVQTSRLFSFHPTYNLVSEAADCLVHISDYAFQEDYNPDARMNIVIKDFISLPQFEAVNEIFLPKVFSLSVGRVEERKGHHVAAKIAQERNLPLIIIGEIVDHSYAKELQDLPYVTLLGPLPHSQIIDVIKKAQIFLWFPMVPETNGRVVIEALKIGTPVLGHNIGALYDLWLSKEATLLSDNLVYAENVSSCWPSDKKEVALAYFNMYQKVLKNHA